MKKQNLIVAVVGHGFPSCASKLIADLDLKSNESPLLSKTEREQKDVDKLLSMFESKNINRQSLPEMKPDGSYKSGKDLRKEKRAKLKLKYKNKK
jgi:hypothetical protein